MLLIGLKKMRYAFYLVLLIGLSFTCNEVKAVEYQVYFVELDVTPLEDSSISINHPWMVLDNLGLMPFQVGVKWQSSGDNINWSDRKISDPGMMVEEKMSYVPDANDVGKQIRMILTNNNSDMWISNSSGLVQHVNHSFSQLIFISGLLQEGSILSLLEPINIQDPDGLGTLSFGWSYRSLGGEWNDIPSQISNSLQLTSDLVGMQIKARVSYTDSHGFFETVYSPPTAAVANLANPAPRQALSPTATSYTAISIPSGQGYLCGTDVDNDGSMNFSYRHYNSNSTLLYKIAKDGTTLFNTTIGSVSFASQNLLSRTDGGIYVSDDGRSLHAYNSLGEPEWHTQLGGIYNYGNALHNAYDGNISILNGPAYQPPHLTTISPNGTIVEDIIVSESVMDYVFDGSGNLSIAYSDETGSYMKKYSRDGVVLWESPSIGVNNIVLAENIDGEVAVVGTDSLSSTTNLIKYVLISGDNGSIINSVQLGTGFPFGLRSFHDSSDVVVSGNSGKYLVDSQGNSCEGLDFIQRITSQGDLVWRQCARVKGGIDSRGGSKRTGIDNASVAVLFGPHAWDVPPDESHVWVLRVDDSGLVNVATLLDDQVHGSPTDDFIDSQAGNDVITGYMGDDTIDGGSGTDIAVFDGDSRDYSFSNVTVWAETSSTLTLIVTDRNLADGNTGIDRLINVETLRFNDGDLSVNSLIEGSYALTVTKQGLGGIVTSDPAGINCGTICITSFTSGTPVTLIATAEAGYQFSKWSGCTSVSGNTCTVAMTGAKEVKAKFKKLSKNL